MSVQEPRSPRLAEGTESSGLEVVAAFFTMSTPSRNTSSKHLSVVCGHVSAQFDVDLFKSQTALGKRNIKCVLVGSDLVTPRVNNRREYPTPIYPSRTLSGK